MEKQSFLKGAFVLMISGTITRILGFILRILLVKFVGDEGLGLFQIIYPVYITLLLLATAGFPLAISKIIPERMNNRDNHQVIHILQVALIAVSGLAVTAFIIFYLAAPLLSKYIFSDPRTHIILLSISPALIFCPLAAVFKGYFQGLQTMIPTAVSQITEQVCRFLATMILIFMLSGLSLHFQAAGIGLGITIGELSSLVILIYIFLSNYRYKSGTTASEQKEKSFPTLVEIGRIGLPVTGARLINSLMMSGEAILIPRQLKIAGANLSEATSLYGQLGGMVEQLIFLPTIVTIALTTSLIPSISASHAQNNYQKIRNNYQDIIRITTYLGFPITIIFYTLGPDICRLVFSFPAAGSILSSLAISSTFIYYLQVSSGMLNGLGKPALALRNLTCGSTLKLILIIILVKQPQLGIMGATIALSWGYILSSFLNYISIGNIIGYKINFLQTVIKPLIASLALYLLLPHLYKMLSFISSNLRTLAIIFISIAVYLFILFITQAISQKDLKKFH